MRAVVISLLLCLGLPGRVAAHDLQHRIQEGAAVTVELFFADLAEDNAFSFESYEVYRAGEEVPFQVGRTDALGRLAFLPDTAGTWRVKIFSEDGHGADISLTTGAQGGIEGADRPLFERHSRLVVGVSILFGIFGLLNLFARRRTTE
jgi:nickel transport protein